MSLLSPVSQCQFNQDVKRSMRVVDTRQQVYSSCKGLLGIAQMPRGDGKIHLLTVTSSNYTEDSFTKNMHSSTCIWLLG